VLQDSCTFVLPSCSRVWRQHAQQPIILIQPKTQFTVFGADVSNVTIVIIVAALISRSSRFSRSTHEFGRASGQLPQDPTTPTLNGWSRDASS